jgi:hypothetical protein
MLVSKDGCHDSTPVILLMTNDHLRKWRVLGREGKKKKERARERKEDRQARRGKSPG